jgi:metallo-beta-lactamase family protein
VKLTFLGAAETVTGSRFLVETDTSRVLVDCGLFQGIKRLRVLNWEPFPVDPASIDAVVITHAHIDHSGYLPVLVREGFRGAVYCSASTRDLLELLLRDAAHLQEEDARYANRHGTSRHEPALPLFDSEDAEAALALVTTVHTGQLFEPVEGVVAELRRAGHILGATGVWLRHDGRSVFFTGDVGRPTDPVMRAPVPPPPADVLVTESTYGGRLHAATDVLEELGAIVERTLGRGGTLLIPSFAVGRTQTVLHLLDRLRVAGRLPDVPVYLNSPMAIDATELMLASRHEHRLSPAECERLREGVSFARTTEESKALMGRHGPMIVVSASGMATGGRVLHHLGEVLPDHRSTVLFVGFQAAGTRGEALLAGADRIKIFGEYVPVRAEIARIEGLSAHADRDELLDWLGSGDLRPSIAYVVHGEPAASDAFRRELRDRFGWRVIVPLRGESVDV